MIVFSSLRNFTQQEINIVRCVVTCIVDDLNEFEYNSGPLFQRKRFQRYGLRRLAQDKQQWQAVLITLTNTWFYIFRWFTCWLSDCQLYWSPSLSNGVPILTTWLSIYAVHLRLRSASCRSSPILTPEIRRENLSSCALSRSPSLTTLEGICGREWKGEKWL